MNQACRHENSCQHCKRARGTTSDLYTVKAFPLCLKFQNKVICYYCDGTIIKCHICFKSWVVHHGSWDTSHKLCSMIERFPLVNISICTAPVRWVRDQEKMQPLVKLWLEVLQYFLDSDKVRSILGPGITQLDYSQNLLNCLVLTLSGHIIGSWSGCWPVQYCPARTTWTEQYRPARTTWTVLHWPAIS